MSTAIRNLQKRVATLEEAVKRFQLLERPRAPVEKAEVRSTVKRAPRKVTLPPRTIDEVEGYAN